MWEWLRKRKGNRRADDKGPEIPANKTMVLFVCTANLSRSPMAEVIFRRLINDDPRYVVMSAGTKTVAGYAPTPEAQTVLQVNHYDTSGLKTTPLEKWMLKRADFVFVMSEVHYKAVLHMMPEAADKCYQLRDLETLENDRGTEVPDPHEKPLKVYLEVFEILERVLPNVLEFIESGPTEDWLAWYNFYRRSSLALGG